MTREMEGITGGRSRELAPNEVFQLSRKTEEAMFSLFSCYYHVWMTSLVLLWLSCYQLSCCQPEDKANPSIAEM